MNNKFEVLIFGICIKKYRGYKTETNSQKIKIMDKKYLKIGISVTANTSYQTLTQAAFQTKYKNKLTAICYMCYLPCYVQFRTR